MGISTLVYRTLTGDHLLIRRIGKLPEYGRVIPQGQESNPVDDAALVTDSAKPWLSGVEPKACAKYMSNHKPLAEVEGSRLKVFDAENDPYLTVRA